MPISNRLPALAAEIQQANRDFRRNAMACAEAALKAGAALAEAKKLLPHGGWTSWLRENCQISERSARRYMQIHHAGLKPATVAVLGIRGSAERAARQTTTFSDAWIDEWIKAVRNLLLALDIEPSRDAVFDCMFDPATHTAIEALIEKCDRRLADPAV